MIGIQLPSSGIPCHFKWFHQIWSHATRDFPVIRGPHLSDRVIHLTRGRAVADTNVTKVVRHPEAMANFSSLS